MVLHFNIFAVR